MSNLTNREDQVAIARYLGTLRDAGPGMDAQLVEAFEKLTPAQLDALIELTLADAPAASAAQGLEGAKTTAQPAPPAARREAPHARPASAKDDTVAEPQEGRRGRVRSWLDDGWSWNWLWFWLLLD